MAAMAATQGVYKRQNTRMVRAARGVKAVSRAAVLPKRTERVETTLSLAIKPAISAVVMRQSQKPRGAKTGEIKPAILARMLL